MAREIPVDQILDFRPIFNGSPSWVKRLTIEASQVILRAVESAIGPAPSIHGTFVGCVGDVEYLFKSELSTWRMT